MGLIVTERRGMLARRGGIGKTMVGCLVLVVGLLVAGAFGGWYVTQHWRDWGASGIEKLVDVTVDKAGLPDEQADEIRAQFGALAQDLRDDKITLDQLKSVVQELLDDGNVLAMGAVQGMGGKYVEEAGLEQGEASEARSEIQRFLVAMKDGSIDQSKFTEVLKPITADDPNGAIQIQVKGVSLSLKRPGDVTKADVEALVSNLKGASDEAAVPETVQAFDFAGYVKSSINRALGRATAGDQDGDADDGAGGD